MEKKMFRVIEVKGGRQTAQWEIGNVDSHWITPGPQDYITTLDSGGFARVREASSGRVVNEIPPASPDRPYQSMVLSPDGKHFATFNSDGAKVWRLGDSTRPVATMSYPAQGQVYNGGISFSMDGEFFSATYSRMTSVWNALTGCEVARFETATGAEVKFISRDGRHALVVDKDVGTAVWRKIDLDGLLAEVCTHVTRNLSLSEWRNDYRLSAAAPPLKCENIKQDEKESAEVPEQGNVCNLPAAR